MVIGDLDEKNGGALLKQHETPSSIRMKLSVVSDGLFQTTEVTNWKSWRTLFEAAIRKYTTIDYVCANAGMREKGPFLLQDDLDEDSLLAEPVFKIIDANLNGVARSMAPSIPVVGITTDS